MRLGVARALVDGDWVEGDVEVRDGRIAAVGVGAPGGSRIAAPGFVDLQVNGFAGIDFSAPGEDGYARAGEALLASGVTAYQPTIVTAEVDSMVDSLQQLREAEQGPRLIGAHLEGPFISPKRPGAHDKTAIREPDSTVLERLLDIGPAAADRPGRPGAPERIPPDRGVLERLVDVDPTRATPASERASEAAGFRRLGDGDLDLARSALESGPPPARRGLPPGAGSAGRPTPGPPASVVSQVTLAPEQAGALGLVDALVARGIVVSLGHTEADAATAHAAFDRGASGVTHIFNAMRPPEPRDPGVAFAALGRDEVFVTAVGDGHHLAADTVRTVWLAARDRFVLVTDAVAAAGAPDGDYTLGGVVPIRSDGGVVRTADGALAGSTLTMLGAVRNLHALGIPLAAALRAATEAPARMARRPDLGRISPGAPADLLVLDESLGLEQVFLQGAETL